MTYQDKIYICFQITCIYYECKWYELLLLGTENNILNSAFRWTVISHYDKINNRYNIWYRFILIPKMAAKSIIGIFSIKVRIKVTMQS